MRILREANKVLCVDDSHVAREIIESELGKRGYVVRSLGNPLLVIKELSNPIYDLLILDVEMPGINGIDLLKKIREDSSLRQIPIIMLTSHEEPEYLVTALEAGADDFVSKPVVLDILEARLRNQLRRYVAEENLREKNTILDEVNRQLMNANKRIEEVSRVDPLTGMLNRRSFDKCFTSEWQRLFRYGLSLCVLMIDIDYFKKLNDTLGHVEGDRCLQRVAKSIERSVTRAGELVARFGGEEFVVLSPQISAAEGLKLAEKIIDNLKKEVIHHPNSEISDVVTLSVGVYSDIPSAELNSLTFVKRADKALYLAKAEGRDRAKVWSAEMEEMS